MHVRVNHPESLRNCIVSRIRNGGFISVHEINRLALCVFDLYNFLSDLSIKKMGT